MSANGNRAGMLAREFNAAASDCPVQISRMGMDRSALRDALNTWFSRMASDVSSGTYIESVVALYCLQQGFDPILLEEGRGREILVALQREGEAILADTQPDSGEWCRNLRRHLTQAPGTEEEESP